MPVSESLPAKTNEHFLGTLIELSNERDIEVGEDIYSHTGVKLISRGTRVDHSLYQHIIQHKLRRPLELSLVAGESAEQLSLREEAERLLDERELLRPFARWSLGRVTAVGMLEHVSLTPAARTLLAVLSKRQPGSQRHGVMVALIAMGLANMLRYNDAQMLASLTMAGLYHDLGEVYIDPAFFAPGHRMTSAEWVSYTTHPVISAALCREVVGLDRLAQTAILEHHERLDGFGYPRSLSGAAVSAGGRVLGLAEMLAGMIDRQSARTRIDIALKIMPGEIEPELVTLVCDVLGECCNKPYRDENVDIHAVFGRVGEVLDAHHELAEVRHRLSPQAQRVVDGVFDRFGRVQRAFASTGADGLEKLQDVLSSQELEDSAFEIRCVLDEITWRLAKLGRDLVLQLNQCSAADRAILQPLADALVGELA